MNVAPCGIVCNLCQAYQLGKCDGCQTRRLNCGKKVCSEHKNNIFTFCYECSVYPCISFKYLTKRYNERYGVNIMANNVMIKEKGLVYFSKEQEKEWTCPKCSGLLSMHADICLKCGYNHKERSVK